MTQAASSAKPSNISNRLPFFDSLRGVAMILMAIYHFCFDLNNFGVLHEQMNDSEAWLDFRAVIMTLFMGLVGVGIYLGHASWGKRSYWIRLLQIAGCALLISFVTYEMFGESWVFFGVLHLAVLTSLLGPALRRSPWFCFVAGVVFVALPLFYRSLYWFRPILVISGLSPLKPFTEDFAPLCPWLGVSLLGIFVGYVARQRGFKLWALENRALSRLGHHSLGFYMIHQAILFPIAWLVSRLTA